MARSEFITWLPLDDWFKIMGLNPLHTNQLSSTLFSNNVCGDVWFQNSWLHSDRVGRDDIALAIQQAEKTIAAEAGYNLIPDWTEQERLQYTRPSVPEVYNIWGTNPRFQMKSVELKKAHVISGGVRTKSIVLAGAAIVRSDADGDGYSEHCTVTVPTSVTDENEIRIYYPGESGADAWEIRPIKVSLTGGNAVITFKSWQVVDAAAQDILNAEALDAADDTNYETTVDVYRVYNDPSTQVQFLWESDPDCLCGSETCTAGELSTQAGCFHIRDERLGLVVPVSASWDAATSKFVFTEWSAYREPDQIRFWYYSGYKDMQVTRPNVTMAPYWQYAVAVYAASLLERPVCGCSNANQFIDKWRRDSAFGSQQEGGFTVTAEIAANKLGTSMGAIYAYKRIQQNGMKVNK